MAVSIGKPPKNLYAGLQTCVEQYPPLLKGPLTLHVQEEEMHDSGPSSVDPEISLDGFRVSGRANLPDPKCTAGLEPLSSL